MVSNKVCPHCGSPLMKIDHYGDKRPIMEMLEDDLEALRASVRRKRH